MPRLDAGEVAAIALAANHPDALLLMDEAAGRAEAARRGIHVTGTLGILRDAASAGLVDLSSAFAKLKATSFRAPAGLIDAILDPQ
jgi:predicted nucleic acid-binding protein